MREFIADARNIYHQVDGDKVTTTIEAVIVVSSQSLEFHKTGLIRSDKLETIRFAMTIGTAEALADDIMKWIASAHEGQEKLQLALEGLEK